VRCDEEIDAADSLPGLDKIIGHVEEVRTTATAFPNRRVPD
jgi:hypothetical protein